jgi:hypothetical protein
MRSYGETEERMHDLRAIYVNLSNFKGGDNLFVLHHIRYCIRLLSTRLHGVPAGALRRAGVARREGSAHVSSRASDDCVTGKRIGASERPLRSAHNQTSKKRARLET